jgi:hypothetical protein
MSDMRNLNLALFDHVEDEVAITRHDENATMGLINLSAAIRCMRESLRSLNKSPDDARGCVGIVLDNVSVNTFEIALRQSRETNSHPPWRR